MKKPLHRICLAIVATLVVLAASHPARAQEVSRDAWDLELELGLNVARGNSHLTLFSTSLELTRVQKTLYELSWSATALYGENADSVVARRYRTGFSFDWRPEATITPFIFADAERDRFRKLDMRTNLGIGAKYTVWREERSSGSVSAAILHDYQRFTSSSAVLATPSSRARWSFRAKARGELENGVALENVTFFRPVFDDISDYDIEVTTKASLKVSDQVAVTLNWALRYDSTPPIDVRRDDQVLQLGLSLEL